VLGIAFILPAIYLTLSLINGKQAPANPWNAVGLEWTVQSPPTTFNFPEDDLPVVTWEAYEYYKESHGHDHSDELEIGAFEWRATEEEASV
jgi:cytochrome c oxidase subunit I